MFERQDHSLNGQTISALHAGPAHAPVMLMLHGFPEFSLAWEPVAKAFAYDQHVVLPDQRGCGRSSKPEDAESYRPDHLTADMAALIESLSPDRPVIVCGHDWGASVAYDLAFRHADRVSHLIVANGVHPLTFQRALLAGGAQNAASQYIETLRAPGSAVRMAENDFARTFKMLEKFSATSWLGAETKARYRAVWRDALPTMIHWYRATPLEVPPADAEPRPYPFTAKARERFRVRCPHLVVWGMDDTALLPEARTGLGEFCDDMTIQEVEGTGHWLLHERPTEVARAMRNWLAKH